MKLIKLCGITVSLFLMLGVGVAQAQFTLLPSVEEGTDCNQILNDFELQGNFKNVRENAADAKDTENFVNTAKKNVEAAKKKLDDIDAQYGPVYKQVADTRTAMEKCQTDLYSNSPQGSDPVYGACDSEYQAYEATLKQAQSLKNQSEAAALEYDEAQGNLKDAEAEMSTVKSDDELQEDSNLRKNVLACGIVTGRISLTMLPYYITYIADFLLGLSGVIAMLFIVVGGYFYIWGGLTDNKEKGKKTVINAIIGLIFATLSWAIVSLLLSVLTS